MENGRNWQGGAALLLAGLALFVALSGRLNFNFSISDGGENATAPAQTFRIEKGMVPPNAVQGGADSSQQLQDMQNELDALRQQLGDKGQAIAPPVLPAAPQVPQLKLQPPDAPDAPQIWQGGQTERHFGPFGGGFHGFGGGPFSMLPRLLPLIGLGLLAFFFFRRRRWAHWQQHGGPQGGQQGGSSGGESARRATTPLQPPTPPEGPSGVQS